MSTPEDRDYVVGTHDAEIERLRLQHHLWRHRVLDCWRRAKLRPGYRVADIGAGPGYASLDLAELVGPTGHVHAVERSRRFLSVLSATLQERRIGNVTAEEADLKLVTFRSASSMPLGAGGSYVSSDNPKRWSGASRIVCDPEAARSFTSTWTISHGVPPRRYPVLSGLSPP